MARDKVGPLFRTWGAIVDAEVKARRGQLDRKEGTTMKLISTKTGEPIEKGATVTDWRGDKAKVIDWYAKAAPSSGRVVLQYEGDASNGRFHEYYPSVIDAEVREVKDAVQNSEMPEVQ